MPLLAGGGLKNDTTTNINFRVFLSERSARIPFFFLFRFLLQLAVVDTSCCRSFKNGSQQHEPHSLAQKEEKVELQQVHVLSKGQKACKSTFHVKESAQENCVMGGCLNLEPQKGCEAALKQCQRLALTEPHTTSHLHSSMCLGGKLT